MTRCCGDTADIDSCQPPQLTSHHTQAVVEAKTNFVPNRVLGASPPDISPLESLLPRSVRTTLAGTSCVLVTVGSWTLTKPALSAAYQMSVRSVEWHDTP